MIDVSVYLFGGLGNRLFQMASCLGIARKRGRNPRIAGYDPGGSRSPTAYVRLMKRFDPHTSLRSVALEDLGNLPSGTEVFREKREFEFDPDVLKPDAPKVLFGYFQAESYFREYRDEILYLFREPTAVSESLDKTSLPFAESYFIHLRFGDFLTTRRKNHFIDLKNYYRLCLSQFPNGAKLLIFSDEPQKIDTIYPGITEKGTIVNCDNGLASLHAMARCRLGGICANSTFSWWGAYLNPASDKTICMPDRFVLSRPCGRDFYPADTRVFPVDRPRSFVVNLDRRKDRWARVSAQFDTLQTAIDIRRYPAVEDKRQPYLGCTRSHKNIVSMARDNRWPLVMVMEDDIVIKNPRAVIELLDFLYTNQVWDICFGGVSTCRPESWSRLTGRRPSRPVSFKRISDRIMEIPLSLSTVMVIYHRNSYDKVLSLDETDTNQRIDVFLSENIERKWVHVPFLAYQRPDFSDILMCETDTRSSYEHSEKFLQELKNIRNLRRQNKGRSE